MTTANVLLLIGNLGGPELIIIMFVILLLFGGKKIPELMKGLGKGVRSFKQGMSEIENEINRPVESAENEAKTEPKSDK